MPRKTRKPSKSSKPSQSRKPRTPSNPSKCTSTAKQANNVVDLANTADHDFASVMVIRYEGEGEEEGT